MSTTILTDTVQTSSLLSLIDQLKSRGISKLSLGDMSFEFYPDIGLNPNLEPPIPDAKQAAKDAIEAARRAIDEDQINLEWSMG